MEVITMCNCCIFNRSAVKAMNNSIFNYKIINRFKNLPTMAVAYCKLTARASVGSNTFRMMSWQAKCGFLNPNQTIAVNRISFAGMLSTKNDYWCRWYTTETDDKKRFVSHSSIKQRDLIHGVIKDRKERFQAKKNQLKESSQDLLKDIKKTKNEMKERMEEVIEKENIYTIPNFLTVSRIVMSPYLGYLVIQTDYKMALGLFAYAAITDAMDGMIARRYPSQQSKIGSFLDPMADKVLIATLFLSLTYVDLIPVALTGMIVTRDLLLVGAGFYIRYQSLPGPKTLSRYFDATHATAQLQPTFISKMNTLVQLALVASTLAAPVFNYVDHPALHALWYFTALSTAVSALSYIVTKNTYRFNEKKIK